MMGDQLSSDSDVLFSSKNDSDHISKKWFFDEKNLAISFDDMEIKFTKLMDFNNKNMNFLKKEKFKMIDVEICNFSDSTLLISNLELDSTESIRIFLISCWKFQ